MNTEVDYSDQTELLDQTTIRDIPVTIIGVGGIGSAVVIALVHMGFRTFVLWDNDSVDPRNPAVQVLFTPKDYYQAKAVVAQRYLEQFGARVTVNLRHLSADDPVSGIVISGVDSMAARQEVWQSVVRSGDDVEVLFDGRIGADVCTLLTVDPSEQCAWYEQNHLYDDADAAPLPCGGMDGERAIIYPAIGLSAFICAGIQTWLTEGTVCPRLTFDFDSMRLIRSMD